MALPRNLLFLAPLLLAACSGGDQNDKTAPLVPRVWERLAIPSAQAFGSIRGFSQVRGIIHSHSPYSHDACDGHGLDAQGKPDPTCTANFRRGICDAAEDYVFLTDHAAHMADAEFPALLFIEPGDEPLFDSNGAPIANFIPCKGGRRVMVMVGNENTLMSAGLERHLPGDPAARFALYDGKEVTTADAMHDAKALVLVAHTESKEHAWLSSMPIDGVEIYNVHAAIDPNIRKDYLGLDSLAAGVSILPFTRQDEDGPQPDLALMGFLEDLPIYGQKWDALLATRHVTGTAGTDVHENTFASILRDGERGDSYRRLMRWFSNVALIEGDVSPASVKSAILAGRSFVAFEILGIPEGFDFHAENGGAVTEMGGQTNSGATIVAHAPQVRNLDPAALAPTISMRVLRIADGATTTVGEAGGGEEVRIDAAQPGVYRVEIRIVPKHLRPYLGDQGDPYITERPWLFSNPIRLL